MSSRAVHTCPGADVEYEVASRGYLPSVQRMDACHFDARCHAPCCTLTRPNRVQVPSLCVPSPEGEKGYSTVERKGTRTCRMSGVRLCTDFDVRATMCATMSSAQLQRTGQQPMFPVVRVAVSKARPPQTTNVNRAFETSNVTSGNRADRSSQIGKPEGGADNVNASGLRDAALGSARVAASLHPAFTTGPRPNRPTQRAQVAP